MPNGYFASVIAQNGWREAHLPRASSRLMPVSVQVVRLTSSGIGNAGQLTVNL